MISSQMGLLSSLYTSLYSKDFKATRDFLSKTSHNSSGNHSNLLLSSLHSQISSITVIINHEIALSNLRETAQDHGEGYGLGQNAIINSPESKLVLQSATENLQNALRENEPFCLLSADALNLIQSVQFPIYSIYSQIFLHISHIKHNIGECPDRV
jgi:hypothetical protein